MKIKLTKLKLPKPPKYIRKSFIKANILRQKIKFRKIINRCTKISILVLISIFIISTITAKFSDLLYPVKYQVVTLFIKDDLERKYYLLNDQVESLNLQILNSNCVKAKFVEQNILNTARGIIDFAMTQYTPDNFHPSNYFETINTAIGKINAEQNNCFDLSNFARYIDSIELVDIFKNQKIQSAKNIVSDFKVKYEENKKFLDNNLISDQNQIDKYIELLGLSKREIQRIPEEINGDNFKSAYFSILMLKHIENELDFISKPTDQDADYTNFSELKAKDLCLLFPHNQSECLEETISGVWNSINSIENSSTRIIKSVESLKAMSLFGFVEEATAE